MAVRLKYKDGEYTFAELARISTAGVSADTIRMRIRHDWPVDLAVELPSKRKKGDAPICGATSFYDCFNCRFQDCIVNTVYFKDSPFIKEHYL